MFRQLDIVSQRGHSSHDGVDNVLNNIVRIMSHFVFSDAMMQHTALIFRSSLNIRL